MDNKNFSVKNGARASQDQINQMGIDSVGKTIPLSFLCDNQNKIHAWIAATMNNEKQIYFVQLNVVTKWLPPNQFASLLEMALNYTIEFKHILDPQAKALVFENTNRLLIHPKVRLWLAKKGMKFYGFNKRGKEIMIFRIQRDSSI